MPGIFRRKKETGPEEERGRSMWQLAAMRLRRHKLARISAYVLLVFYLSAVFATFIAPYGLKDSNRAKIYHPPTRIHIFDENGRLTRPFVYNYVKNEYGDWVEDKSQKYPIRFFVRGSEHYLFWVFGKTNIHLFGVDPPAVIYLFGSDHMGRDMFSRILFGSRVSLFIGWASILISTSIGMLVGGISGYYGGWVDNVIMRICEIIQSIPSIYLLMALAAFLAGRFTPSTKFIMITAILAFLGWAGMARVIRGMVLSIKTQDFVEAARAIGASDLRIIVKHILPNTMSFVIVAATVSIPGAIISESSLSFIGLGIQEPSTSWGMQLSNAMNISTIAGYPWLLLPGLFIFLAVLAFNLFGDGVRDALDPKSKL